MTLDDRKDHVLRFVKLGLDLYSSMLLSECTDEEIESLENDKSFLRDVEICNIIAEKELLEKYDIAMEIASSRGNTNPIQWRLSKLNPDRWGTRTDLSDSDVLIPANIVLRGGKVDKNE